jgi:ParB family chromosome partitioning protein
VKLPDFAKEGLKDLQQVLEAEIKVVSTEGGKGKISIPFNSKADFKRLVKQITGA